LASGETISGSTWSVEVVEGSDPNAADMLSGSPSTSGSKVSHLVTGGLDQILYCIVAAATTSLGQVIHGTGLLNVDNDC
jgi:hypothetical protein